MLIGKGRAAVTEVDDQGRLVPRLPPWMRSPATTVAGVARGARDDRISGLAAEVAFFAALSVLPSLVAIAAALTLVPRLGGSASPGDVEATVVGWLQRVLTEQASDVTREVERLFDRANGDVFTLALVVALWSGSRGIDAVLRAIVVVSDDAERRPWWKRRLISLGLLLTTIIVTAVVLSMFVVGPLLGGAQSVADHFGFGRGFETAWSFFRLPVVAAVLTAWSLLMLHVGRSSRRRWRADLSGAVVTMVLWVLASLGLRIYLGTLGSTNLALGALGGPLIGLVWLYLLAAALLLGAEVAQQARGERPR